MVEKLLTIREVASLLDINEKEVIELSENGVIPAYKVGGVYLRFKKEQIELYKSGQKETKHVASRDAYTATERLRDFFYFYDFYLFSFVLVIILLLIILKG